MEPTRIELDLPVVILNRFANIELENHQSLATVLSHFYPNGTVISLHVIAESTGDTRGFCEFIDENSTYKNKCGWTLNADGKCDLEETHEKAAVRYAESLAEDLSN